MDKDKLISDIYYDLGSLGSIKRTYEDVKAKDKSISYNDVKEWYTKNIEKTGKYRRTNSYIAKFQHQEWQMDIAFFNDLHDPEYNQALVVIDIFTKYAAMQPLKSKQGPDIYEAFIKIVKQMDGKPEMLYTDNESGFNDKSLLEYYKEHNIDHIITLGHANYVERFIRTIKSLVYKRVKQFKGAWHTYIYPSILIYNTRMKHSATGLTPAEATKKINHYHVGVMLERTRKLERQYPEVKVGDMVKLFAKKKLFTKEHIPYWTENKYEVIDIIEKHNQLFYKVKDRTNLYLRAEILKV